MENIKTILFGVEGKMGAGKTHVLSALQKIFAGQNKRLKIISVDEIRRHILTESRRKYHFLIRKQLIEALGIQSSGQDKFLDGRTLGQIIFANKEKMDLFKKIINPIIKKEIIDQIKASAGFIAVEWAWLEQDGFLPVVDNNLLIIKCRSDVRRKRLFAHADISPKEMEKRIKFFQGNRKHSNRRKNYSASMRLTFDNSRGHDEKKYRRLYEKITNNLSQIYG